MKLDGKKLSDKELYVAPFAGAWIEILDGKELSDKELSLPSRERGLKSTARTTKIFRIGSLPSRERGLKSPFIVRPVSSVQVAPFAGAWIEMIPGTRTTWKLMSLPSRERGLKYLCM